ncbi:hypothetical protein JJJ17_13175 [Paracoccus caeni]|uniref:Uncharacterized protein n=1 Tax=Paracoccus caeni TaxID=657651 RepID=A0A934W1K1_9RHOB|nr:DUF6180 family protein [Paracoccus caeni]MBK4216884.1 hypothetical protein [Paracoccus caeni]
MKTLLPMVAAAVLAGPLPLFAQSADFSLTYHVERLGAEQLSIEQCGEIVAQVAAQAGLRAAVQAYPGQLVTVSGGADGAGAFVTQCITVDAKTVVVVQGIDYQQQKGSLGSFADQAFAAVKTAAN